MLLGLLHFFWVRSAQRNFAEVAVYAAVVALRLVRRAVERVRSTRRVRVA